MSTTASKRHTIARDTARRRALFEGMARRFYAGVYNYLCWLSRDTGLAEDLTQETFMQIWQHPPELRGARALKTWVYRVARNQYLQHRRRAGLETIAFEDCEAAQMTYASAADPQLRLEKEQLRRAVRRAVQALPEPYREVIVLHNVEGLSLGHVAEVLELPKGTVKSRRAKAFSMLRRLLGKQEGAGNAV